MCRRRMDLPRLSILEDDDAKTDKAARDQQRNAGDTYQGEHYGRVNMDQPWSIDQTYMDRTLDR